VLPAQASVFSSSNNELLEQLSSKTLLNSKFLPKSKTESSELRTQRYQQQVDGIEVLGAQSMRHTRNQFQNESSNFFLGLLNQIAPEQTSWTHQVASFNLDTRPTLSESEAVLIASNRAPDQDLSEKPKLLILPNWKDDSARLVYRVMIAGHDEVAGRIVDVDAHTGQVLASVSRHWEIAPVDVYQTNKRCQTLSPVADSLGGRAPISVDFKRCSLVIKADVAKPTADDQAAQAFSNSQQVLKYYSDVHHRNSFDDQGSPVVNVVHIGDKWSNAFWNSEQDIMAYGDGDGKVFRNLTLSVDVAGHEMTHGVVSKTANLEYQGESGALNEGFADFFGETIEGQKDWVMGRDLFFDVAMGENGIRNLKDPHKTTYKWQDQNGDPIRKPAPASYDEIFTFGSDSCDRSNDNCGVHMNATLIGHTGYLMVSELGRDKAEKLFYNTLIHYMTETSDFHAFAKGMREACQATLSAADCASADKVLTQVGL